MKRALLGLLLLASSARAEDVVVQTLELRPSAYSGKFEVLAFPAVVQVSDARTLHVGAALGFAWHVHENFGVQLSGFFNPLAKTSAFSNELVDKVRMEPGPALLVDWGTLLAAEVTPFHGKFAWYSKDLVHFSVVLSGGGGVGGTRHELKPDNDAGPATHGDTGVRPLGSIGGGFRVQFGEHVSVRLEVRDLFYSGRVDAVNGCNREDLKAMDRALRGWDRGPLSASCKVETFEGSDPATGLKREDSVPLAYNLTKGASPGIVHNVGLQLGVGFLF